MDPACHLTHIVSVDVINGYHALCLFQGDLHLERMGRGFAWPDTGTHASLLDAGNFVPTPTERQGLQVGSPDEVAFQAGWIDRDQLVARAEIFKKTSYGKYLSDLAE